MFRHLTPFSGSPTAPGLTSWEDPLFGPYRISKHSRNYVRKYNNVLKAGIALLNQKSLRKRPGSADTPPSLSTITPKMGIAPGFPNKAANQETGAHYLSPAIFYRGEPPGCQLENFIRNPLHLFLIMADHHQGAFVLKAQQQVLNHFTRQRIK